MEETRKRMLAPRGVCKHCGGIMRYYRGSTSCLMCGREGDHECPHCQNAERLRKTA